MRVDCPRLARLTALLCFSLLTYATAGCSEGPELGEGGAQQAGRKGLAALQGSVEIDGSSTVFPISEAVASAYQEQFPDVAVTVGVSGTGGGFKRFTRGEIDISDASRPIEWAEFEEARKNKVSFIELPVAYDGLSIVVHPANDWVQQLTVADLKKIFLEEQAAQTWRDVNPQWPATQIKIYAPGTDSGTFDYFKEVVAGDSGSMRSDMSTSEDDNALVTGVAGERGAIGFFGANYYFNNKAKLKAVPIMNPETNKPVLPTPEDVESGNYAPFSRPLLIYVNEDSLRRPEMKKFVEFYIENAGAMAKQVDYVSLPQELYDRAQEHFENRLAGTHFWQTSGQERHGALTTIYTEDNLLQVSN